MSVLWQVGWVIGGLCYAVLQATLGFDAGYTVNFLTIITLYSIATCLYWIWFRDATGARWRSARRVPDLAIPGRHRPSGCSAGRRAGRLRPWQRPPLPSAPKTAIPRNPGRHELGMQAKLLFPDQGHRRAASTCRSSTRPAGRATPSSTRRRSSARRRRARSTSASMQRLISNVIESGPRLHDRAHRVHVRAVGRVADAVAPARAPPGGRRLRPAEPALRQVQGRGHDAAGDDRRRRPRAARALRGPGRRARWRCTASSSRPACRARTRGSCSRTPPARTS